MKIWNEIPIKENKDKLIAIPSCFKFISPHPYLNLGAPYDTEKGIWRLRKEVVKRLIKANEYGQRTGWESFDGQKFWREHRLVDIVVVWKYKK